jgi:hypothetical protein
MKLWNFTLGDGRQVYSQATPPASSKAKMVEAPAEVAAHFYPNALTRFYNENGNRHLHTVVVDSDGSQELNARIC